ncbi:MAG: A/G-specific adenine glycosylase [Clostridiales bacterium]|nr:A/G-specific adenine glycosylase [Clostridiales bacterium]
MEFSKTLLEWYDRERRALPWRGTKDPYRVWLSEIMLQQTRAEAVAVRYEAFLRRFPDVRALAGADEQAVLKAWEGMGYYSRARNLLKAAKIAAESGFPRSAEGLRALPGIGAYTAGAIASIAFNLPEPALDGNQIRVLSRVLLIGEPISSPSQLREAALARIDRDRPGDYNQALMDLGSGVCMPRNPGCGHCPVRAFCRAFAEGDPESYPKLPPPVARREVALTVMLLFVGGRVLVRQRPSKGLLGGLWEFPNFEGDALPEPLAGAHALSELKHARHVFTHLVWNMRGIAAELPAAPEGYLAVGAEGLKALPFPTALRAYREIALDMLSPKGSIAP